ncbi:MAG TPA: NUDIX domain-containing protein [Bacteroidales bacterium]|nr:NUDIX domain-containing protein [Bacteroidales bacterium]
MYKVFFNEKIVLLTDDFIRNFQVRYGIFYKYRNVEDLKELIDFYWNLKRIDTLFLFHHDIDELRERFKSCFDQVYAAGGLVRNTEGKYLIMKRRGKWDLPKGKLNRDESFESGALREVNEECGLTGLEITGPLLSTYHCYQLDDQAILKKTSWFEMVYRGNAKPVPQWDEDITEIIWCRKDELAEITCNTYLAVIDVLKYQNLL